MKKTVYQCDCCGTPSEEVAFSVSFREKGEMREHDLCDKCYARMRAWLWCHEGVAAEKPTCYALTQEDRRECNKFWVQKDPINWCEHLLMSPAGMQELLLKFCEGAPDDYGRVK